MYNLNFTLGVFKIHHCRSKLLFSNVKIIFYKQKKINKISSDYRIGIIMLAFKKEQRQRKTANTNKYTRKMYTRNTTTRKTIGNMKKPKLCL